MAGRLILPIVDPSLDPNGNPVSGATLTFYQNGTTTPQAAYTDTTLLIALANPLTADSAGRFPEIWVPDATAYSVKWVRTGESDLTFNDIYGTAGPGQSKIPTQQIFTSGSGTYTTPSGCRRIRIRALGGGAGGCSSGSASAANGTAGGNTTFGASLTASGGTSGTISNGRATAGGAATGGDINIPGGSGMAASGDAGNDSLPGASGGNSFFGGAGQGQIALAGLAAATNSGSGGAGGGGASSTVPPAPGGSAGGYLEKSISAPSATYAYAVGAKGTGGAAGTSGFNGGDGAAGIIIVDETY